MAGASLLTLIDDIATILDDVSVMTKVAAKKTTGMLADDLAVNAQQVAGVKADRELPVVWAVAKGSMLNKVILVPAALVISAFAPWAITPILMFGGLYLCFEAVEKLYHQYFHHEKVNHQTPKKLIGQDEKNTVKNSEKEKIKGAIRTDLILSAEIIVITLGTVATSPFSEQVLVLAGIATLMTVGVYGVVAGIVKLDDGGLYLSKIKGNGIFPKAKRKFGLAVLTFAPYMMKGLSIVGTVAMFLVGGAILTHSIPVIHHFITEAASGLNNGFLSAVMPTLLNGLFGILAGITALIVFNTAKALFTKKKA